MFADGTVRKSQKRFYNVGTSGLKGSLYEQLKKDVWVPTDTGNGGWTHPFFKTPTSAEDLQADSLEYRRAKDKSDKSLEVYKFFVNALYVALTRAIRNLYLIQIAGRLRGLNGADAVHRPGRAGGRRSS